MQARTIFLNVTHVVSVSNLKQPLWRVKVPRTLMLNIKTISIMKDPENGCRFCVWPFSTPLMLIQQIVFSSSFLPSFSVRPPPWSQPHKSGPQLTKQDSGPKIKAPNTLENVSCFNRPIFSWLSLTKKYWPVFSSNFDRWRYLNFLKLWTLLYYPVLS